MNTIIRVDHITTEKIVFNVSEPAIGMFGGGYRTKQVEMPLDDVVKIIDAINWR